MARGGVAVVCGGSGGRGEGFVLEDSGGDDGGGDGGLWRVSAGG